MSPQRHSEEPDSLEIVELEMELESLRSGEIGPGEREECIRKLRARLAELGYGDLDTSDDDDDLLGALVRKLGPKGPLGKSGASVRPEGH